METLTTEIKSYGNDGKEGLYLSGQDACGYLVKYTSSYREYLTHVVTIWQDGEEWKHINGTAVKIDNYPAEFWEKLEETGARACIEVPSADDRSHLQGSPRVMEFAVYNSTAKELKAMSDLTYAGAGSYRVTHNGIPVTKHVILYE